MSVFSPTFFLQDRFYLSLRENIFAFFYIIYKIFYFFRETLNIHSFTCSVRLFFLTAYCFTKIFLPINKGGFLKRKSHFFTRKANASQSETIRMFFFWKSHVLFQNDHRQGLRCHDLQRGRETHLPHLQALLPQLSHR